MRAAKQKTRSTSANVQPPFAEAPQVPMTVEPAAIKLPGPGRPSREPERGMIAIIERRVSRYGLHGNEGMFGYIPCVIVGTTAEGVVSAVHIQGEEGARSRGYWTNIWPDLTGRVPADVVWQLRDPRTSNALVYDSLTVALSAIKGALALRDRREEWVADKDAREQRFKERVKGDPLLRPTFY